MAKPALDWWEGGTHAVYGGRGKIAFYKIHQSTELKGRWLLTSYMKGLEQSSPSAPSLGELQNYAEADFSSWLKRTKLAPVKE